MPGEAAHRYEHAGFCPACLAPATFRSDHAWYRDHLLCEHCGSVPRERALALVLNERFPNWRDLRIHEASPLDRGISKRLREQCRCYTPTYFRPDEPRGAMVLGNRNEDLEAQTFPDASFDVVISLDVMEHLNEPDRCCREVWRTLADGGAYLFTAPTYKDRVTSARVARFAADGGIEHYEPPEYHGNPVDPRGSLVTFRWGYDFPEVLRTWAPFDVRLYRFHDHRHGVIGEFTEVYLCEKRPGARPR